MRAARGNGTRVFFKYNAVVVGVGVVYHPPYHSLHRMVLGDEGDHAPGYHVRVRWWDPIQ